MTHAFAKGLLWGWLYDMQRLAWRGDSDLAMSYVMELLAAIFGEFDPELRTEWAHPGERGFAAWPPPPLDGAAYYR